MIQYPKIRIDLLCNEEDRKNENLCVDCSTDEGILIETLMHAPLSVKRRVLSYYELISCMKAEHLEVDTKRNVSIIQDADGKNIVLINDILFKSRRLIDWDEIAERICWKIL